MARNPNSLGIVPTLQDSEETVFEKNIVGKRGRRHVHVVQLIEVLCSIAQEELVIAFDIQKAARRQSCGPFCVIHALLRHECWESSHVGDSSFMTAERPGFSRHVVAGLAGSRLPPRHILDGRDFHCLVCIAVTA